jgi:hypothetical protein
MATESIERPGAPATALDAPQLVLAARCLYFGWLPADPAGAAALLPEGLRAAESGAVFMNQYVVDRDEQTSGLGRYSVTYLGVDLAGLDLPDGLPSRWFTHYVNSSERVRAYAGARGLPVLEGDTTVEVDGDRLVGTLAVEGRPVVRTVAHIGGMSGAVVRGRLRYLTEVDGDLMAGLYAYVAEVADACEVVSLEFLDRAHPVHALRPATPLRVVWALHAPRLSFCWPGGEGRIR